MNLLFNLDNLTVLKALLKTHSKSIKCAYLDPPYNTGVDRKHFEDTRKSKDWLKMMRQRIKIVKHLMREDGSIWISIDDSELYNLKPLCDEIFGKENYLATIIWQHIINWDGYKGKFQLDHTYILGYKKSNLFNFENNLKPHTVWLESEVGGHVEAIAESEKLFGKKNVFSTPKPERLMSYLLQLTTKEQDMVLDIFSGSGTMGAAAQKMKRNWIMIEIGKQCKTHILPRMKKLLPQHEINKNDFLNKKNSCFFSYFQDIESYKRYCKKNPRLFAK